MRTNVMVISYGDSRRSAIRVERQGREEGGGEHTNSRIRHDDHHIGVGGEALDESCEVRVSYLHALELRLRLGAAELELFDDGGDLLEELHIYFSIKT